jgi:serine/threonine protein phosphatase PrpC
MNQDSILVKQNISKKDIHMIAVADGHGQVGHHVSQFIIKNLSKLVSDEFNQILSEEKTQTSTRTQ